MTTKLVINEITLQKDGALVHCDGYNAGQKPPDYGNYCVFKVATLGNYRVGQTVTFTVEAMA